jgi:hypothetical protein
MPYLNCSRILTGLTLLLLPLIDDSAQNSWTRQSPIPTARNLDGVAWATATHGFISGRSSTFMETTDAVITREQMAAFMIRAIHEPGYVPPEPGSQRFVDVPPANRFCAFIDEMVARSITSGCSTNPSRYCPGNTVTRAQMAAFLVRAFGL